MSHYQGRSLDEQQVASIVAALGNKRDRESDDADAATIAIKKPAKCENSEAASAITAAAVGMARFIEANEGGHFYAHGENKDKSNVLPMDATGLVFAPLELRPAPFFYYVDHSLEPDDDSLTPLTPAGRVPTFPASEF